MMLKQRLVVGQAACSIDRGVGERKGWRCGEKGGVRR